jgi:hypothetical protein
MMPLGLKHVINFSIATNNLHLQLLTYQRIVKKIFHNLKLT